MCFGIVESVIWYEVGGKINDFFNIFDCFGDEVIKWYNVWVSIVSVYVNDVVDFFLKGFNVVFVDKIFESCFFCMIFGDIVGYVVDLKFELV